MRTHSLAAWPHLMIDNSISPPLFVLSWISRFPFLSLSRGISWVNVCHSINMYMRYNYLTAFSSFAFHLVVHLLGEVFDVVVAMDVSDAVETSVFAAYATWVCFVHLFLFRFWTNLARLVHWLNSMGSYRCRPFGRPIRRNHGCFTTIYHKFTQYQKSCEYFFSFPSSFLTRKTIFNDLRVLVARLIWTSCFKLLSGCFLKSTFFLFLWSNLIGSPLNQFVIL